MLFDCKIFILKIRKLNQSKICLNLSQYKIFEFF